MKLTDIDTLSQIAAGEYLFHQPSGQIVVCGQIRSENDKIKVLKHGRIFEDKLDASDRLKDIEEAWYKAVTEYERMLKQYNEQESLNPSEDNDLMP